MLNMLAGRKQWRKKILKFKLRAGCIINVIKMVTVFLRIFVIKDLTRALLVPSVSADYSTNDCMRNYYHLTATFCGGGVNFLVKSMECDIISTSYMTDEGNRLMFYARVLTGDYTDCKHTGLPYNYGRLLQAPPVKDASKGTRYNSVVDDLYDPRQFAVFHNDQSYPDYLITYTFG